MKEIAIFDSTLRDGAQGEGISFSVADKIRIALTLDELGIPFVEAGNPGSNAKDLEFFKEASKLELKKSMLVAFGATRRANTNVCDDANLNALLTANTKAVAIFGKSWDFHVTDIIKTTLEENINMISDTIKYLKSKGKIVIYDAEHFFDGYKNNMEYALRTLKAASDAGADYITLCDTNGGAFPDEVFEISRTVCKLIGGNIGIHAHEDAGMAISNSIMAVFAGCNMVQGTFVGFGERCGNANLSAIISNLQLKKNYHCIDDLSKLTSYANKICEISNVQLNEKLPYVGKSAFAHKAGMHIDGVLKNSESFEHVSPSAVGNDRRFLVSEVAGRSTVVEKICRFVPNVDKNDPVISEIIGRIKELEYLGYQFEGADASFELLVRKIMGTYKSSFVLDKFKIITEDRLGAKGHSASAIIKINVDGKEEIKASEGEGPVNALDTALRNALEVFYPKLKDVRLTDYKVRVLEPKEATAANVRVLIESSDGVDSWSTVGVSNDIIEASWQALVDSLEYKIIKDYEGGN